MLGPSLLMTLLVVWIALTAVLLAFLIYRSILGFREDDQISLTRAEVAKEQEQIDVTRRINRLDSIIKRLALASGGLLLLIAVIWVYRGLTMPL